MSKPEDYVSQTRETSHIRRLGKIDLVAYSIHLGCEREARDLIIEGRIGAGPASATYGNGVSRIARGMHPLSAGTLEPR